MKKIVYVSLLLFCCGVYAQNPKERDMGDFSQVKVFDRMHVNLIKSTENKVELSGRDIDDIELVNKGGLLKIRMHIDKVFDGDRTFVKVFYNKLKVIDGNEGSRIVANELIEQNDIEIRAQEGAQIEAGLEVKNAEIRAVTGGIIQLNGRAAHQHIEINTGGIFEGKELHTETTAIRVRAGGEAAIYASQSAEIKVRAGGDIHVYGNPKEVEENKFIGGTIKIMR
ncbi:MAG TPA: DUF2807 domain-containing protein [Leeuwenhoekiella sp.]|nr:DUF2807 domain-containing protein [Leeuwenhoekiella sp.]